MVSHWMRKLFGRALLMLVAFCTSLGSPSLADIRSLPVPVITIYPGEQITEDMLTLKKFSGSAESMNAMLTSADQIVGRTAKRTLLPGKLIPPNALKLADSIKQGTLTSAVYRSGGLVISTYAVALKSGVTGDMIEARNPETGVVMRAIVQADGTLMVAGP